MSDPKIQAARQLPNPITDLSDSFSGLVHDARELLTQSPSLAAAIILAFLLGSGAIQPGTLKGLTSGLHTLTCSMESLLAPVFYASPKIGALTQTVFPR